MAGAIQQKLPEQDSGLMDLLKIFSSQMGGGTKTTTSSSSPEANSQASALLAQIQGGANPELLQNLAMNILDKANQSITPAIAASVGAGNRAFSDTALQDAVARARAYATEAISKANLDFIQESNRTAASLVNTQLQTNRVTKETSSASTLGKIGTGAATALGTYAIAKKIPKLLEGVKGATGDASSIFSATEAADTYSTFEGLNTASDAWSAADAADTYSTFESMGSAAGDTAIPGIGSAINLLSGNNEGGQAGENFVLSQIPGVGPILALANSLDVPIVSDIVDFGGDIVSDVGDSLGCFITTAVTKASGKPDNCYELETLRKFRDEYMLRGGKYQELVQQYYNEAPGMVKYFELSEQKASIYKALHLGFILPAIFAIEQGENAKALEIYATMFYFARWLAAAIKTEILTEVARG